MCLCMCVFYSRSAYVSTCWRETRGCSLTTHHMNCHRRERSGVYSIARMCEEDCVCVCVTSRRCFVSVNHCCELIYLSAVKGGDTQKSNRTWGRWREETQTAVCVCVKSRCHLNEYEMLILKSHHQHRDRGERSHHQDVQRLSLSPFLLYFLTFSLTSSLLFSYERLQKSLDITFVWWSYNCLIPL